MNDTALLPVQRSQRRAVKLFLVFAALAGILAIVGRLTRRRPPPAYDSHELSVEADSEGFVVQWRSSKPYRSRLKLLSPQSRVVEGTSPTPRRNHQVVVTDCPPGTLHRYAIMYPAGQQSLRQTVMTAPARCELVHSRATETGVALAISLQPKGRQRQVRGLTDRGQTSLALGPAEKGYELVLPAKVPFNDATIEVSYAGGVSKQYSIAAILRSEVAKVCHGLKGFDKSAALQSVERQTTKMPEETMFDVTGASNILDQSKEARQAEWQKFQEKLTAICRRLEERLEEQGVLTRHRRACALAPLAWRGPFLTLDEKVMLHERLRRLQDLSLFMGIRRMKLGIDMPDWGPFALSRQPPPQRGEEHVLFENFRQPLRLGNTVLFSERKQNTHRFELFLEEAPETAAVLCVTVQSFRNQSLRATVNDLVDFSFVDRPVHPAGREVFTFFQHLPVGVIRQRMNELRLTCDATVGRLATRAVAVTRVAVLFVP